MFRRIAFLASIWISAFALTICASRQLSHVTNNKLAHSLVAIGFVCAAIVAMNIREIIYLIKEARRWRGDQ